jgi:uncharacterized protein (TIGR02145 family)
VTTPDSVWADLTYGAFCVYDNDASNADTYGYLYNFHAVNRDDFAPEGWHVPTDAEWKELEIFLGMSRTDADGTYYRGTDEGGKLKEIGTLHWDSPNTGATNESGFFALPGGFRRGRTYYGSSGSFYGKGRDAYFWSSTYNINNESWYRNLYKSRADIYRWDIDVEMGLSVRCVRDN